MVNNEIILRSLDIICASRIWKDKTPSHTLRILMYMNSKNWLYVQGNAVIGAYRVPDTSDETLGRLPTEEIGNKLYIPFVLSLNKEYNIYGDVRKATTIYLEKNQDIREIVLEGKDDRLRIFKIGERYGQEQRVEFTSDTTVY